MNAKEWLSRAFCLEKQVQSKLEMIEVLKSLACRVTAVAEREPVKHTRDVTSLQDTVARIIEAEEELNRKIDELVAMKLEISRIIDQVQDVVLILLLEKRYLSFQSWDRISVEMGYSTRWVMMKHREALDKVQRILDGTV